MYVDPTGEAVPLALLGRLAAGAAIGAATDLAVQLYRLDRNIHFVDWARVGIAAGVGAITGRIVPWFGNRLPPNASQLDHVFDARNSGHMRNTPRTRRIIEELVNNPIARRGPDRFGNTVFSSPSLPGGGQY